MAFETRCLRTAVSLTVCVAFSAFAQGPRPADSPAKPWAATRTADGQPNLQGYWTNDTYTPLERPAELAGKEYFTPEEAAAFFKLREDRLARPVERPTSTTTTRSGRPRTTERSRTVRTSMIVEPRDGKLPPLTSDGQAPLAHQKATQRATAKRSARRAVRSAERCISWGNVGPPMMPPTYTRTCRSCRPAASS